MNYRKFVAVCAGVFLLVAHTHAQPVLTIGDTEIVRLSSDSNYGTSGWLHVNNRTDALFAFDVTGISAPVSAELQVELVAGGFRNPGPVFVYELTGPWNEDAVTWSTQPTVGEKIADRQIPASAGGEILTFDVSSLVDKWIDNPSSNFGLTLRADGTETNIVVRSRESQNGLFPARLLISPRRDGDNIALGKTVAGRGVFFKGGFSGGGQTVDFSSVTDGVEFDSGQRWSSGSVWWEEGVDTTKNSITVYLGNVYEIRKLIVQLDNNDDYVVSWNDQRTGLEQVVLSPTFIPFTGGLAVPVEVEIDAVTSAFVIEHEANGRGDGYYAVSEFQAFGY